MVKLYLKFMFAAYMKLTYSTVFGSFIILQTLIREGTFLIGGGGSGLRRGESFVNILQIWEGQNCFICNWGRVIVSWQGKITPCRLVDSYSLANTRSVQKPKTCIYEQYYQSKFI